MDTENVLLVASKGRAQDLKKLLERLRSEGLEEYLLGGVSVVPLQAATEEGEAV